MCWLAQSPPSNNTPTIFLCVLPAQRRKRATTRADDQGHQENTSGGSPAPGLRPACPPPTAPPWPGVPSTSWKRTAAAIAATAASASIPSSVGRGRDEDHRCSRRLKQQHHRGVQLRQYHHHGPTCPAQQHQQVFLSPTLVHVIIIPLLVSCLFLLPLLLLLPTTTRHPARNPTIPPPRLLDPACVRR